MSNIVLIPDRYSKNFLNHCYKFGVEIFGEIEEYYSLRNKASNVQELTVALENLIYRLFVLQYVLDNIRKIMQSNLFHKLGVLSGLETPIGTYTESLLREHFQKELETQRIIPDIRGNKVDPIFLSLKSEIFNETIK